MAAAGRLAAPLSKEEKAVDYDEEARKLWDRLGVDPKQGILARYNSLDAIYKAPSGGVLYVGGQAFFVSESALFTGVAKWTGTSFEAMGNGGLRMGTVRSMLPFARKGRPELLIGGGFTQVNYTFPPNGEEIDSPNLAIWRGCTPAPCPGDVTGDGTVDLADLNLVLASFGQATDSGDTNDDGVVDLADLNAVLGAFGTGC